MSEQDSEDLLDDSVFLPDAREIDRVIPHSRYDKGQVILCVGKRGHGKTTAMKRYTERHEPRLFGPDMFHDFFRPDEFVDSLDEAVNRLNEREGDRYSLFESDGRNPLLPARVGISPPSMESTHAFGSQMFESLISDSEGNFLLVMDEITLWTKPGSGAGDPEDPFCKIVLQGRRLGIRIIAGVQRLSMFPRLLQAEITQMVIFRTTSPTDVERIANWTSDDIAQRARTLKVGQAILVNL